MIERLCGAVAPLLALAALPATAAATPSDYNGDGRADVAFHRPDGIWGTVPVLTSNGAGGWTATNTGTPSWANQLGVAAIAGDYDGDGRGDVAFHRPGSTWNSVPVLRSNGAGGWIATNMIVPDWANQAGVVAIPGDYNGDGRTDIAFHRPDGVWGSVPVLMSNGAGGWTSTNNDAPGWANEPGAIAIAGDHDGDGRGDIAFHRPGSSWNTAPVLISNGAGGWTAYTSSVPGWVNQPGAIAVPGDYNADGRTDVAFHRPDGGWNSVPVLTSNGNGSWTASNVSAPGWANQPGVNAIPGDFNGDGRADIAFHRPDGVWGSVPVLLRTAGGSWSSTNAAAPTWANEPGAIAIPGRYDGDARTDIAFHRPGGAWTAVPVLRSSAGGGWISSSAAAPSWANQPHAVAIRPGGRSAALASAPAASDGGDPEYDTTPAEDVAWRESFDAWINFLRLFVRVVLGYDEYVRQSGLIGYYDGVVRNGNSEARAFLDLQQNDGEVNGVLTVLSSGLRLRGGVCPDVVVPPSALPIHAVASDLYHASGVTSREVDILGLFSGTVDAEFELSLDTVEYRVLTGTIDLDVPWPCSNQSLSFRFERHPL